MFTIDKRCEQRHKYIIAMMYNKIPVLCRSHFLQGSRATDSCYTGNQGESLLPQDWVYLPLIELYNQYSTVYVTLLAAGRGGGYYNWNWYIMISASTDSAWNFAYKTPGLLDMIACALILVWNFSHSFYQITSVYSKTVIHVIEFLGKII